MCWCATPAPTPDLRISSIIVGVKDMLDVEAILENLYVYPFRDKRIFASEYRQMLAGGHPHVHRTADGT